MKKKLARAISERVKGLREEAGLSQQEVATKADLSVSLVAKIEQGKKADPRASTLLALAKALHVPPGKLLDDLFPARVDRPAPARETPDRNGVHASEDGAEEDGKKKGKKKKKGKGKKKAKHEEV